jgi:hypothetical protein
MPFGLVLLHKSFRTLLYTLQLNVDEMSINQLQKKGYARAHDEVDAKELKCVSLMIKLYFLLKEDNRRRIEKCDHRPDAFCLWRSMRKALTFTNSMRR